MFSRRMSLLEVLFRIAGAVLIILIVITLIGFIHFYRQHPQFASIFNLLPAVFSQVYQMVRMTLSWVLQSWFCPNKPPFHHNICSNNTPVGCVLPPKKYSGVPRSVNWFDNICCSFTTESLRPASCLIERDMFSVVSEVIQPDDVVLEVGARYGTTSCAVAETQQNSGKLITVEADPSVWGALTYNMDTHSCSGHQIFGVLGEKDLTLIEENMLIKMPLGYAKMTSEDEAVPGVRVAHFTWNEVEQKTGLKITSIIFDCEGCMFPIIAAYGHKFSQIQKVIIENDNHQGPNCDEECQDANTFFLNSGFVLESAFLSNLQTNYVYVRH